MMIVTEQVQRSMDQQVRGMLLDRHALVRGLGLADAFGEDDVAEQQFRIRQHRLAASSSASAIGKGQYVGRLVLAAPLRN